MTLQDRLKCSHFSLARWGLVCIAASFAVGLAHADPVDDYVHTEMAKRKIPGLSVAVLRDHQVIKDSAYGLASVELNVPVTQNTSFALASMTKTMTAAAIMLLVQDGKIALDDPVRKTLPQLPEQWSAVTIRHCLSHTSGLPDALTDDVNVITLSGERDVLLDKLAKLPVQPAGEKSAYNQTGYMLLGMLIEKVSGTSYAQFMQERLFKPAGMPEARFGDAWSIIPGRSNLYTALDVTPDHTKLLVKDGQPVMRADGILHYGAKFMPDYLSPAGLLNDNVQDLIKWEQALLDGKILSAASVKQMTTAYKLKSGADGDYGLGFLVGTYGPFAAVAYGGGAATWRLSLPEKHLTVVVLTNLQGSQPHRLAAEIAGLYEPDFAKVMAR